MRKTLWLITILLALLVGAISFSYILEGINTGYLERKSNAVLKSNLWWCFLYAHIISGGIAIVIGWTQFSPKIRIKYASWHRNLGKIYILASLICSFSGLYIGFFATGGWLPASGFISLSIIFFYTTLKGFLSVKDRLFVAHKNFMTYSYSLCLAAVTLRVYIPLAHVFEFEYILAYSIIAWLSWIPNLTIAWFINNNTKNTNNQQLAAIVL